jgi:hypothetical protein
MTGQVVQQTNVPYVPPARTPRSSILNIAEVREGISFLDPDGLVWSYNCIGIDVNSIDCAGFTGMTKRFDGPSSTDGAMFVVQGGMRCKPFGFSVDDPAVRKAFEAKEPEGVSTGLYETVFASATDITPGAGTGLPPTTALGLLEGKGQLDYAGDFIIHLGPGMVSMLATNGAIRVGANGILTTMLGTPIAVSAGYETKTAGKLDADQWAFVTGAVVLARGEVQFQSQLDRDTNDITALYERLYIAGVDCLVAKVKVKVF